MRRALAVSALGSLCLITSSALASDTSTARPWHRWGEYSLAIGAGVSHYSDYRSALDDGSLSDVKVEESDDRLNVAAGFVGRNLGFEVSYENIGRARLDARSSGGPRWLMGRLSSRIEGRGLMASVLLRAPAHDRWVSQLRLGILSWTTNETSTEAGTLVTRRHEDSGTSFVAGVSGELRLRAGDQYWLRAEVLRTEVDDAKLDYYVFAGSFAFRY